MRSRKSGYRLRAAASVLLAAAAIPFSVQAQEGTVSGVVRGEGRTLAFVQVEAVVSDVVRAWALTDEDGVYSLTVAAGSYTLVFRAFGHAELSLEDVAVQAGATTTRDVELVAAPIGLEPLVATAARGAQGELEVPTSVSVVNQSAIERRIAVTPMDHVIAAPGVDVAVQGLMGRQVIARGFNGTLTSSMLLLTDYRNAALPAPRSNLAYFMAVDDADLERVEVVRGPASALYGPNAADGVVHFITKSPFDSPGTTLRMAAGGRNLFEAGGRYATAVGESFAFKVSGSYFRGHEWPAPPNPVETILADPVSERWKSEVRADWRLSSTATAVLTLGTAKTLNHVDYTAIGRYQVADWRTDYAQLRFNDGALSAQIYFNGNPGGGTSTSLTQGAQTLDHTHVLSGQVQHGFEYGSGGSLWYGIDVQRTNPQTLGTINGRFEADDLVHEYGAYVQSSTPIGERLRLLLAARVDHHDRLEGTRLSPRVGVTFTPRDGQSFRASFNRAFATPDPTELFGDILVGPAGPYSVRAVGVPESGIRFARTCGGLCLASPFTPGIQYGLDVTPLWPVVVAAFAAEDIDLSALPAPSAADVGTSLRVLNLATLAYDAFAGTLDDLEQLRPTITSSFEVGYKGLFAEKLLIDVAGYTTERHDFIGPLTLVSPNAFLSTADLATWLGDLGVPDAAALAAFIGGVDGDPALTGIPLATPDPAGPLAGSDILMTYQNVGDVRLWGADVSVRYAPSPALTVSGSYSWVNENLFPPSRPGEPPISTNAPRHRGLASVRYYLDEQDLSLEARGRAVGSFRMVDGVLIGDVDGFALADLEAGFAIPGAPGARMTLTLLNVFDERHSEFFMHPVLGRQFLSRLEVRF